MCTLSFWYNVVVHLIDYSIVCFPSSSTVKNLPAMQETSVQFLGWEDALKKETATTPVFLFTEFHGQRSLEGFSPRGHQELDMTEWLTLSLSHSVDIKLCDIHIKFMWYSHYYGDLELNPQDCQDIPVFKLKHTHGKRRQRK